MTYNLSMKLSPEAFKNLKEILIKDFGSTRGLSDEDVDILGITLLELAAIVIKRDIRLKDSH